MKNLLASKKVYLAGPIECSQDDSWRKNITYVLETQFKLNVFDPFADDKQTWLPAFKKARSNNDIEGMSKISRYFVRKDLATVDRCDFLIAYLPVNVQTTGTVHEIINSNNQKKPTLLVSDINRLLLSTWYFGFISPEFMFDNWHHLYEYLDIVNEGKNIVNSRWDYTLNLLGKGF